MSVIIVRVGEKTFKNILIGPGKLPGLSRNGPQKVKKERFKEQKQWPCKCGESSSFFCRHLQNNNVKLPNLKLNAFATDYILK